MQRASELAEGRVSDRGSFDARRAAPGGSVGGALRPGASRKAHRSDDAPLPERSTQEMVRVNAAFGRRAVEDHGGGFRPTGRCRPGGRRSENASRGESVRGGRQPALSRKNATCIGTRRSAPAARGGSFDAPARSAGRTGGGVQAANDLCFEAAWTCAPPPVRSTPSAILMGSRHHWEVVQWQDTRLWTVESGFESLLPSQPGTTGRTPETEEAAGAEPRAKDSRTRM